MRRFIYYDKDGIESYVAQISSGVLKAESREITNGKETAHTTSEEKTFILILEQKLLELVPKFKRILKMNILMMSIHLNLFAL